MTPILDESELQIPIPPRTRIIILINQSRETRTDFKVPSRRSYCDLLFFFVLQFGCSLPVFPFPHHPPPVYLTHFYLIPKLRTLCLEILSGLPLLVPSLLCIQSDGNQSSKTVRSFLFRIPHSKLPKNIKNVQPQLLEHRRQRHPQSQHASLPRSLMTVYPRTDKCTSSTSFDINNRTGRCTDSICGSSLMLARPCGCILDTGPSLIFG